MKTLSGSMDFLLIFFVAHTRVLLSLCAGIPCLVVTLQLLRAIIRMGRRAMNHDQANLSHISVRAFAIRTFILCAVQYLRFTTLNFTAIILNFKRLITNDNTKIDPLKNGNR